MSSRWRPKTGPAAWWRRRRWRRAKILNGFYLGHALRLPLFLGERRLLRFGLLLLLLRLAHALQLFVDLLRRFDAVGRLRLGAVVRICSVWRTGSRRSDGWND